MPAASYPVRWAGRLAVVAMPAEVGAAGASEAEQQLQAVLSREPVTLIVDMTSTARCDSAGMAVILRTCKRAASQGVELRLVASAPAVRRALTVTGVSRLVNIYPTLAASLAAQPPGVPRSPASPSAYADGPAAEPGTGG